MGSSNRRSSHARRWDHAPRGVEAHEIHDLLACQRLFVQQLACQPMQILLMLLQNVSCPHVRSIYQLPHLPHDRDHSDLCLMVVRTSRRMLGHCEVSQTLHVRLGEVAETKVTRCFCWEHLGSMASSSRLLCTVPHFRQLHVSLRIWIGHHPHSQGSCGPPHCSCHTLSPSAGPIALPAKSQGILWSLCRGRGQGQLKLHDNPRLAFSALLNLGSYETCSMAHCHLLSSAAQQGMHANSQGGNLDHTAKKCMPLVPHSLSHMQMSNAHCQQPVMAMPHASHAKNPTGGRKPAPAADRTRRQW